jgi:hypothetical protein
LKKYFFLQNLDISEKNIINVKAAKVIYGSELSLSLSLSLSLFTARGRRELDYDAVCSSSADLFFLVPKTCSPLTERPFYYIPSAMIVSWWGLGP